MIFGSSPQSALRTPVRPQPTICLPTRVSGDRISLQRVSIGRKIAFKSPGIWRMSEQKRALWYAAIAVCTIGIAALWLSILIGIADTLTVAAFKGQLFSLVNIPGNLNINGVNTIASFERLTHFGVILISLGLFCVIVLGGFNLLVLPRMETALWSTTLIGVAKVLFQSAIVITSFVIWKSGYNSTWYAVEAAINFTTVPPFLHRVLFPLIARGASIAFNIKDAHRLFLL